MSSLFKYFPATYIKDENGKERNYALESIKNNTLWASIPDEFNDLFECAFYYTEDDIFDFILLQYPEMIDWIDKARNNWIERNKIQSDYANMQDTMECIKKRFGITCFSQTDIELLMWGHYANSHKGICIEYDEEKINKCKIVKAYVSYVESLLRIKVFTKEALEKAGIAMMFMKSKRWEYEQEVRAIATPVKVGDLGTTWEAPIPKSIRLGVKADERLKAEIKDLCKEKGIELYQMKKVPGQYAIEKIKIDL